MRVSIALYISVVLFALVCVWACWFTKSKSACRNDEDEWRPYDTGYGIRYYHKSEEYPP